MKTLTFVMLAILATVSTAASSPDGNPPDCDNLIAVHEKQKFDHFQAQAKEELALIRKQEEKMKVLKDQQGWTRQSFLHPDMDRFNPFRHLSYPRRESSYPPAAGPDWDNLDLYKDHMKELERVESELKQAHKEAKLKMQRRHAEETLALIRKTKEELKAMKCLRP